MKASIFKVILQNQEGGPKLLAYRVIVNCLDQAVIRKKCHHKDGLTDMRYLLA